MIQFKHLDVVFGQNIPKALTMLDEGADRDKIFADTQNLVAVHDATLDVEQGQICVLMGLSGSGKSSLIRCVNGLNPITRGQLLVRDGDEEIDMATCGKKAIHHLRTRRISMVFQQFALMPWRTVSENISFGLELSNVKRARRKSVIEEKLKLVRLQEWADNYPSELSGGMQQRVGLARALATDADILLMDEPFSALDPLIREHLQDELLQLQEELKKTIIFVSHDLDEAMKLGSLIAIMEGGRIVQSGTPEDIISNPVNNYVKQFVASMNPLKVLNCGALISTTGKNEAFGTELDSEGKLTSINHGNIGYSIIPYSEDLDLSKIPQGSLVSVGRKTSMNVAVELNYITGIPVPVLAHNGQYLGSVGSREILKGILKK